MNKTKNGSSEEIGTTPVPDGVRVAAPLECREPWREHRPPALRSPPISINKRTFLARYPVSITVNGRKIESLHTRKFFMRNY